MTYSLILMVYLIKVSWLILILIFWYGGDQVGVEIIWRSQLNTLARELRVKVSCIRVTDHLGLEGGSDPLLVKVRPVDGVEECMGFHSSGNKIVL